MIPVKKLTGVISWCYPHLMSNFVAFWSGKCLSKQREGGGLKERLVVHVYVHSFIYFHCLSMDLLAYACSLTSQTLLRVGINCIGYEILIHVSGFKGINWLSRQWNSLIKNQRNKELNTFTKLSIILLFINICKSITVTTTPPNNNVCINTSKTVIVTKGNKSYCITGKAGPIPTKVPVPSSPAKASLATMFCKSSVIHVIKIMPGINGWRTFLYSGTKSDGTVLSETSLKKAGITWKPYDQQWRWQIF